MTVERVADHRDGTGEGPLWHPDEEALYWVDIPDGELYRYDLATDDSECVHQGERLGGFTIQEDGSLLLFLDRGAVKIWDDGIRETVIPALPEEVETRFNDVIAGPEGRVYCGTMPEGDTPGRLYRLDTDGRITQLVRGVGISNGMGFTPDLEHLYFTESEAGTIDRFAFDRASGTLSDRTTIVDAEGDDGMPDGMTVDAQGYLWSARWNGWSLVRHRPDGHVVERVQLPARKVSALTFGGPDYGDAYVTTALGDGERPVEGEGGGALFRVDLGVEGVPEFRSAVAC
jgi:sugar lactone lactonase YvrE